MSEFGAHAPKIVPYAAQDGIDLGGRFFRKCGNQILAADAVFRQQRTDRAHQPATEIGHPVGIGEAQTLEQRNRESAQQRVADALAAAPHTPNHSPYPIRHQKFTMTLPNTCRLSSRARPRSKSASVTSVSMIGAMPAAIFDRLSRILRIEAPNETKILYCCWNSCIRLMVSLGLSLALSKSMCSVVPKAIGAQAASRSATPAGTGITRRADRLRHHRAKPSIWKPMMPPTFSHRLSRPSRQAAQCPQVMAPYITTLSLGLKPVTPAPAAAISPDASAPTTSGSLRLAKAMPRKPHRSR